VSVVMLLNYAESIISPYKFFSYLDLVGYVKDSERSFTSKAIADFILSQLLNLAVEK
jgi:hypothetical protein